MRIERVVLVVAAGLVLLATTACEHRAKPRLKDSRELDEWFVTTGREAGVRQAIIVQHTLYDYHFVPDSAHLNDLGYHDLGVLSEHFAKNPGELSVRQGQASETVYRQRLETVRVELVRAGVATERVSLTGGLPGGPGMPGTRVVFIVQQRMDAPLQVATGYGAGLPGMGQPTEQGTSAEARP